MNERRRQNMTIVQRNNNRYVFFASASFFLVISIFASFLVSPVLSNPETEYVSWFSQRDTQNSDGSSSVSSLPPPPGDRRSEKKLQKCTFDSVVSMEEEESITLLNETLIVDGCLLECSNKILHSTIREGSIVTVRNGGHIKNCDLALIDEKDLNNELAKNDLLDKINQDMDDKTKPKTSEASYWNVTGFLCDQGECVIENSNCTSLEYDSDEPPTSLHIMRECVLVQFGATDVHVQGGLVAADDRPISFYGIHVDAFMPSQEDESNTKTRLFVDRVMIRTQLSSGILVLGGANTVRITDSIISNNGGDGIFVYEGYSLSYFAVLGGSAESNRLCGINVLEYQMPKNSIENVNSDDATMVSPVKVEMFVSDVLLGNNGADGLSVMRLDDITIDGATFDGNGLNGIAIYTVTTLSLQGVISKKNGQNGLFVEAIDAVVEIANSVFLANGKNVRKESWERAGVYMWLAKQVSITNSVSNRNGKDGILIWDVPDLKLADVDAMNNGNNGIQIRESSAAYGYDYTANSNYLVGAYYYPWHGDDFHNGGGYLRKELVPRQSPTLGEYNDSDSDTIRQHLEWFRKSNIGLVVTSWWGPNRIEDSNTRDVLMEHEYIGNLKVALHYETTGRVREEAGDDMSNVASDIEYMCDNYFDHPNYYKIDGRPVLVLYISRKLDDLGTLPEVLVTMRGVASKCGHNIYLIGDAVFAKAPEINDDEPFVSFTYFDAVTNYDVYGSSDGPNQSSPYAGTEGVDNFYAEQEKWRELALKENCRYIPPVSPGYNDRGVRMPKDNQPLSRRLTQSSDEGSLFKYQLEKALPLVDPDVGNLILVNSFNEWHEDTQIEPARSTDNDNNTATEPEEYTLGLEYVGYGELYLDILRNATGTLVPKKGGAEVVYEPSNADFEDVRSCRNGEVGMRFYVAENSLDDQAEFVFKPRPGVISCSNKMLDYQMFGGGNVDFDTSLIDGLVGDKCANGNGCVNGDECANGGPYVCEFSNLLEKCQQSYCRHRSIVTTTGGVIDVHKIQ